MASACSDFANSPEAGSSASSTPAGGSSSTGGNDVRRERAPGAATAGVSKITKGKTNRGVANLTPEQLAKKRANDREAQRAIRERTRRQIDALERRIEELTNQKPYQELQAVVRAKEAVDRENADIKRQLATIMSLLQPLVGPAAGEVSRPNSSAAPNPPATSSVFPAAAASPSLSQQSISQGRAASHSTSSPQACPDAAVPQLQGLSMGGDRLGLDFLLRPGQLVNRVQAAWHGAQDTPQYRHVPMKHDGIALQAVGDGGDDGGGEPWAPPFVSQPTEYSGLDQQATPDPGHCSTAAHDVPLCSLSIRNTEPTCPLDTILLNFLSERRQRIAEGLSVDQVIGPRYPSVSSLLNPTNSAYSHPLSKIFTDILARFPDISRLPERVAVLYVMFLVMRWQISPTRDNYERLPEWMTPRQAQMDYAHAAWIDYVPFPAMRERLAVLCMSQPGQYELEQFFIPYTTTLRVSWPYEETDALLMLPDGDQVIINPVFERHMRNIDNWTLGEAFARAFPELADTFRLEDAAM